MTSHKTAPANYPRLVEGVSQDGGTFYHDGFGAIAAYDTVRHDHDMVGARKARLLFAEAFPAYVIYP